MVSEWKRFVFTIKNAVLKFEEKDIIVNIILAYAGSTFNGWNTRAKSKGQSLNRKTNNLNIY